MQGCLPAWTDRAGFVFWGGAIFWGDLPVTGNETTRLAIHSIKPPFQDFLCHFVHRNCPRFTSFPMVEDYARFEIYVTAFQVQKFLLARTSFERNLYLTPQF